MNDSRALRMIAVTLALVAAPVLLLTVGMAADGPPAAGDGGAPKLDASTTVRIVFQTIPPEKAVVMWGPRPLGKIGGKRTPLIIFRPRDSGPLDVVIRADGYLPVHTRAYTFTDSKLDVKLTLAGEKHTLFGYREELPDAGAPDGGATPPVMTGPPSPDAGRRRD